MIEAINLHKSFGKTAVLHGVSFAAADGAITGLLGPNGAGKTTAMRCILGLLAADSGSSHIDGIDVTADPAAARARLGVLPDQFGLYVRLTAREHLAYFGRLHGLRGRALDDAITRSAEDVGITDLLRRRVEGFSAGERMKLGLARALLHGPNNLVLDEPSRGLDVMSTRSLRALLARLRDAGRCIVFSSHVMTEVAELCDHVVIIADGRVAGNGAPSQLCQRTGRDALEDAFVDLIGTTEGLAA